MYASLRDIETALSLSPSHKLSQQRRIQCLMDLGLNEEAKRFLHGYKLQHPSDSKFVAKTTKDLDKTKKDGPGTGMNNYYEGNHDYSPA